MSTQNTTKETINEVVNFEGMTIEQQIAFVKTCQATINKAKPRTAKQIASDAVKEAKELAKEKLNAEKICAKSEYRGLFTIFNEIKKINTFKSLRSKGFQPISILGSMNFNQFTKQVKLGGVYTFEEIYSLCKSYHEASEADKMIISERGAKISTLLLASKFGNLTEEQNKVVTFENSVEISKVDVLNTFVNLFGLPYKDTKAGKVPTINKQSSSILEAIKSPLYSILNCAELFPVIVEDVEDVEDVETIEVIETK